MRTLSGVALIALALSALGLGGMCVLAADLARGNADARRMGRSGPERIPSISGWRCSPRACRWRSWRPALAARAEISSRLGSAVGAAFFIAIVTNKPRLAFGIVYVALPALALLFLREQPNGLLLAAWALATVWATDIGAYAAGRSIGGPKLAPSVSPEQDVGGADRRRRSRRSCSGCCCGGMPGCACSWPSPARSWR